MGGWVYILLCADGTFYVGVTARILERLREHMRGSKATAYTASRLPVQLVWCKHFERIVDAIATEKRLKRWSHAKKQALIDGDIMQLKRLSKCQNASRSTPLRREGMDPE
ncbi:MAG: GIY-YIG nuclease family protein [Bacteroidetes bacterium]|jgi:putative endonuclease|nr:GIY-YIG nuclease family protein [Bacteroidota bacterium]